MSNHFNFSLHQLVSEPTRKDNIHDVFFIRNPTHVEQVMLVPGIRDHGGIHCNGRLVYNIKAEQKQKPRKVYTYNKAIVNYLKSYLRDMRELITSPVNAG